MAKGSSFERKICKYLSLWWTGDKSDAVFWRSSNSGGRATVRTRRGKATVGHYGDIASTDPSSKPFTDYFTLELKCGYPKLSPLDVVDSKLKPSPKKASYHGFFLQAMQNAKAAKSKSWMLIHHRTGSSRRTMLWMPLEDYTVVCLEQILPRVILRIHLENRIVSIVGVPMRQFFGTVTPETFTDSH